MTKPRISIVVAASKNRAIGKENKLIFVVPGDLRRFKELTTGHPIIMGRKTFESIGRALPNRTNIVVSRNYNLNSEGIKIVDSLDKALAYAKEIEKEEIFIIGGGQIYKDSIELADRLYLTLVDKEFEADTFFPDYSQFKKIISEEKIYGKEFDYSFLILEK